MSLLSRRDLFRPAQAEDRVHIASLLLQITPAQVESVRTAVESLPAAEFHATAHPNKYAVLLEAGDERTLADATQLLSGLPGVLTISIVAHFTESADALAEQVGEDVDEDV